MVSGLQVHGELNVGLNLQTREPEQKSVNPNLEIQTQRQNMQRLRCLSPVACIPICECARGVKSSQRAIWYCQNSCRAKDNVLSVGKNMTTRVEPVRLNPRIWQSRRSYNDVRMFRAPSDHYTPWAWNFRIGWSGSFGIGALGQRSCCCFR